MILPGGIASGIAERMLAAQSFDDRWDAICSTLTLFGATSINVASIDPRSGRPIWFRSSLPAQTLTDYVAEDFTSLDLIVRHASKNPAPFRWQTADRTAYERSENDRAFGNFVRDSGERSIVCMTTRLRPNGEVTAITFCSTHDPHEVMADENLRRIETAIRLLLPWVGWPDSRTATGFIPTGLPDLSPREAQALRLLAGGMMNARIADMMGISEAMVAKHLRSARRKMDAKTREEAVATAVRSAQIE